jgi:MFS transporter, FSR family, fosmidomycin resistance protein
VWPLIRDDLGLSYVQIGLILTLPGLLASVVEPALGLLADLWRRKILVVAGGIAFTVALGFIAMSRGFWTLLIATAVLFPSTGAFVSISQTVLMDLDTDRREKNMARWTFAGSVGAMLGALSLGVAGIPAIGWRGVFAAMGVFAVPLVVITARARFSPAAAPLDPEEKRSFRDILKDAWVDIRRKEVLRWLGLLELANLTGDILFSFLALYLMDVAALTAGQTALAIMVWTAAGLTGDFLVIKVLDRVKGLAYLRVTAAAMVVAFPAFLLVSGLPALLVLLGVIGLLKSGWYAVLQARLYAALPGRSGSVLAMNNMAGLLGSLIPLAVGAAAQAAGLHTAMWLLVIGPLAMALGLPREKR